MEIRNNNSIKSILHENKKCIEIKIDKREDNDEFSKKNEELRKILKKEILEDELYKEQKKEIDTLTHQLNELKAHSLLLDDFQKEIINKLNSNFINCINNKFEEIKKYLNEQINININKQLEEILNHIKNNDTKIINKCNQNQQIIKKDIKSNIKGIIKVQNELNVEKDHNSNNKNKDDKEFNYENQVMNDYTTFKNNWISNCNLKRKKDNNYLLNENQINIKKKEKKKEEPLTDIIITKFSNDGENIRNNNINNDQKEYNTYNLNEFKNFRKNDNNLNIIDNNLSYKKKIVYEKKPKEEDLKIKYYNTEPNDRNDKPKINKKTNDSRFQKLYQTINKIFFYDYQQKYIKDQKINDNQKEELQKEVFNDKITGRNILKNYYMNFIETNILPLFKKNKNIIQSKLEIIKYNISIILECFGLEKNYYNNYYYNYERKKTKTNRRSSVEAVSRFRKEFGISKEDYTDEAIENRLIENDLDINKAFSKMFG